MPEQERDDEDLRDRDQWDFENSERQPPVRRPRAVVSVAFARDDFEAVGKLAEILGVRTSEFIRSAALAAVAALPSSAQLDYPETQTGGKWSIAYPDPEHDLTTKMVAGV